MRLKERKKIIRADKLQKILCRRYANKINTLYYCQQIELWVQLHNERIVSPREVLFKYIIYFIYMERGSYVVVEFICKHNGFSFVGRQKPKYR